MPLAEDDDRNRDPTDPLIPPPAAKPPLLNYPSVIAEDDYGETESWSEVGRAILVVFGILGFAFFITFGVCGIFARGCG